ncbi:MAG: hypothetical protein K1X89_00785 [Myxococcaceae bacterium]|nr:hypothetical protein [Myxococcaceae bacterium]
MPSVAATTFLSSALTPADWRQFRAADPQGAVRWAAAFAAQNGLSVAGLERLRGARDTDTFAAQSTQQLFATVENALSLGATQEARAATLGWNAQVPLQPPALTGTLRMSGEQVLLETPSATLQVVNTGDSVWGTDASAFLGQVVTLKGWPDAAGRLVAEEFAPGSSPDFLNGRVQLDAGGAVGIRVSPEKWVALTDPALAAALRPVVGSGVILPGPVERVGDGLRFTGRPADYYLLTALDHVTGPGRFGAKVAHAADELDLRGPADSRTDLLDARRYVYGHFAGGLTFDAAWVGPPCWAAVWEQPVATPLRSVEAAARWTSSDPAPEASFAPAGPPAPPPRVYADGALLREASGSKVYLIVGGAKLHVPDPQQFEAMKLDWNAIRVVKDRSLGTVPDVPAEGTLVKELGTDTAYLVDGGQKRPFSSPERVAALGHTLAEIQVAPDGSLATLPTGAPA